MKMRVSLNFCTLGWLSVALLVLTFNLRFHQNHYEGSYIYSAFSLELTERTSANLPTNSDLKFIAIPYCCFDSLPHSTSEDTIRELSNLLLGNVVCMSSLLQKEDSSLIAATRTIGITLVWNCECNILPSCDTTPKSTSREIVAGGGREATCCYITLNYNNPGHTYTEDIFMYAYFGQQNICTGAYAINQYTKHAARMAGVSLHSDCACLPLPQCTRPTNLVYPEIVFTLPSNDVFARSVYTRIYPRYTNHVCRGIERDEKGALLIQRVTRGFVNSFQLKDALLKKFENVFVVSSSELFKYKDDQDHIFRLMCKYSYFVTTLGTELIYPIITGTPVLYFRPECGKDDFFPILASKVGVPMTNVVGSARDMTPAQILMEPGQCGNANLKYHMLCYWCSNVLVLDGTIKMLSEGTSITATMAALT